MMQQTLMLIKPDTVKNNHVGQIIARIEDSHFRIQALKMVQMNQETAKRFYAVHDGKPFFDKLIQFMTSGNIVAMILEKENAIEDLRTLIGKTNPTDAACGTIRFDYGINKTRNAVHASDSPENAKTEISIIFPELG